VASDHPGGVPVFEGGNNLRPRDLVRLMIVSRGNSAFVMLFSALTIIDILVFMKRDHSTSSVGDL
jgi:hypothetical protein